jgi:hypothetical protein
MCAFALRFICLPFITFFSCSSSVCIALHCTMHVVDLLQSCSFVSPSGDVPLPNACASNFFEQWLDFYECRQSDAIPMYTLCSSGQS